MPLLEVDAIHSFYGPIHAVKGVSLTVNGGEIVTLIGSNGAGKTTTIRTISGIMHARQGRVRLANEEITRLPAHEVVRRGISQSPEGRRIFPRMTVLENLEMGAFQRTDRIAIAADLERVLELFPRLRERRHQTGGTLSGGEQQMLAIARAMMARPRLLLLDEPSMGLSPVLVEQIFEIIQDINRQGSTILLVEQNALMALSVAHRGYILQNGRVILEDSADKLMANPQVRKAYLGEI